LLSLYSSPSLATQALFWVPNFNGTAGSSRLTSHPTKGLSKRVYAARKRTPASCEIAADPAFSISWQRQTNASWQTNGQVDPLLQRLAPGYSSKEFSNRPFFDWRSLYRLTGAIPSRCPHQPLGLNYRQWSKAFRIVGIWSTSPPRTKWQLEDDNFKVDSPYTFILLSFNSRSLVLSIYTCTSLKRSLLCMYVQELCQMHCLCQYFSVHFCYQRNQSESRLIVLNYIECSVKTNKNQFKQLHFWRLIC